MKRQDNFSTSEKIRDFNTNLMISTRKLKFHAMNEDPYRFFRATAHLYFEKTVASSFLSESPPAWICGDMHLENFGSYKGDRGIAHFNLNDFDECLLAPCLFDVARMITSIHVSSKALQISSSEAEKLCDLFMNGYFLSLRQGYIRVLERKTTTGVIRKFLKEVECRQRKEFIKRRVMVVKGKKELICDGKHALPLHEEDKLVLMASFQKRMDDTPHLQNWTIQDLAFRLAGTSSLGLKRFIVLASEKGKEERSYLLDIKETRPSCVKKYVRLRQPQWESEGSRIVEVQKRVLPDPPPLLCSVALEDNNFVLKELQPVADRIDYNLFRGKKHKLGEILSDMGCVSAWGVLRSSGREGAANADALIRFGEREKEARKALHAFGVSSAVEVLKQFQEYKKSYTQGFFTYKK